jgi:hypothetical protein
MLKSDCQIYCLANHEPSLQKRSLFGLGLGFFGWDHDGGGHFVLGAGVEQLDALMLRLGWFIDGILRHERTRC